MQPLEGNCTGKGQLLLQNTLQSFPLSNSAIKYIKGHKNPGACECIWNFCWFGYRVNPRWNLQICIIGLYLSVKMLLWNETHWWQTMNMSERNAVQLLVGDITSFFYGWTWGRLVWVISYQSIWLKLIKPFHYQYQISCIEPSFLACIEQALLLCSF